MTVTINFKDIIKGDFFDYMSNHYVHLNKVVIDDVARVYTDTEYLHITFNKEYGNCLEEALSLDKIFTFGITATPLTYRD